MNRIIKQFNQFYRVTKILLLILVLAGSSLLASQPVDTFETGKIIEKVVCSHDATESYSLYLPKAYNRNQKWPVLFAFEPAARAQLPQKLFKLAAESYGYIIICSTNAKNGPREPIVKAMMSVWQDANARFAIDKNRIYATGFSGGARMASIFHLVIRNPVRGIIAVGAGISTAIKADKIQFAHYYGIVGYSDFNYQEMVRLEKTLKNQRTPHRFVYYEAKHRWPPEEICTRAVEWMDLMAMKEDMIPKDDRQDFISSAFAKESKFAQEREDRGEIFYAAEEYDAIARVFEGLVDVAKIKEKVEQLKKSKAYKKFQREDWQRIESEIKFIGKFMGGFNAIKKTEPKKIRIIKLMTFMGIPELDRKVKKKRSVFESGFAERLLYNVTNKARQEGFAFMTKGEYERAELFWEIAAASGKYSFFHPYNLYNQSCTLARLGKKKKAIKTLDKAVESGFQGIKTLETDKDLDSLRDSAAFKALLQKLKEKTAAQKM
jgi:dienelactone hydrolase